MGDIVALKPALLPLLSKISTKMFELINKLPKRPNNYNTVINRDELKRIEWGI